ncbi:replication initiator [Streptomyces sp. S465]|uniref:replication initiator n=1 Tax=Streptomyces sp. S465 TaxID=2979468 RepID=UPI0022A84C5B|nr:replication initiator [Streptomyces sp. S465]WAP58322.1 hypothetical protein N6H00_27075 [Streptomyces sp. S465]
MRLGRERLTSAAVAGYIAKYATRGAESAGAADRRIHHARDLATLPVRDHTHEDASVLETTLTALRQARAEHRWATGDGGRGYSPEAASWLLFGPGGR